MRALKIPGWGIVFGASLLLTTAGFLWLQWNPFFEFDFSFLGSFSENTRPLALACFAVLLGMLASWLSRSAREDVAANRFVDVAEALPLPARAEMKVWAARFGYLSAGMMLVVACGVWLF